MLSDFISYWNNFPKHRARVLAPSHLEELPEITNNCREIIARGNGRSYGDASLNDVIISTLKLKDPFIIDEENGVMVAGSGLLISEVLDFLIPKGYFLPVVPGTKYITLGGAVAADIHGKNHYHSSSLGAYILSLDVFDGEKVVTCNKDHHSKLFYETIGGMGLTGIILKVSIVLLKISSAFFNVTSNKTTNFSVLLESFEKNKNLGYQAAWLDIASHKSGKINAIYTYGNFANLEELDVNKMAESFTKSKEGHWSIPMVMPNFTLNKWLLKVFNFAYFYLHQPKSRIVHLKKFLFPLDGIKNWNRLYGSNGFLQYQFVIPTARFAETVELIFSEINKSKEKVYLAVLKRLGPTHNNAVMSFPLDGYTLALDFKKTKEVFILMDRLDVMVVNAGGRIYLAKDARMSAEIFSKSYLKTVSKNPKFASLLSKRLGLN
ncbi:MAG TPA: FAD-binding oxidoreductase [Saprospiraceae bacterium]|nr:FAD-binding oxidoreductase [Saprospiraceae bacterium]HPN69427.1 FAD-binding oxidoreductase [Saprospiraceae bacterium]